MTFERFEFAELLEFEGFTSERCFSLGNLCQPSTELVSSRNVFSGEKSSKPDTIGTGWRIGCFYSIKTNFIEWKIGEHTSPLTRWVAHLRGCKLVTTATDDGWMGLWIAHKLPGQIEPSLLLFQKFEISSVICLLRHNLIGRFQIRRYSMKIIHNSSPYASERNPKWHSIILDKIIIHPVKRLANSTNRLMELKCSLTTIQSEV